MPCFVNSLYLTECIEGVESGGGGDGRNRRNGGGKTGWYVKLKKIIKKILYKLKWVLLGRSLKAKSTLTFSRWSWRESMRRSPTGCQDPLSTSAWRSLRSSSSSASWSSCRLSRASSAFLCQSAECMFNLSHSVLTSSACFCRSRVTFWALSSGRSSKLAIWQGFRPHPFLLKKKKHCWKGQTRRKEGNVD